MYKNKYNVLINESGNMSFSQQISFYTFLNIIGVGLAGITLLVLLILASITLSDTQGINSKLNNVLPALPPVFGSCPTAETRKQQAYTTRSVKAFEQYARMVPCHVNNNDETTHPTFIAQFTKGMQHDANGVVISSNYQQLLNAVATGTPTAFASIGRGVNATAKFVNPQAALFIHLVGADTASLTMPPAPTFSSNEMGAEYVELAWMALARDVRFDQFGLEPITQGAITELNLMTDYKGIKPVTASNLFRAPFIGCTIGPYISQFMYMNAKYAKLDISQKLDPPIEGKDFLTDWNEFLRVQNGIAANDTLVLNGTKRYIITPRDIASYVHIDMSFQAYHIAAMILLDMNAPLNPTNPYLTSLNQEGFSTFGAQMITSMIAQVANQALHTVWYQKWFVHRRLRPEAYGGYLDRTKNGVQTFSVNTQAINAQAVTNIFTKYGSYLLPQAFPEGGPLHPSYGAGHATVSAACVTLVKAFFDGSYVLPNPIMPDSSGQNLVPFVGPNLTVEGELNKLSASIGIGRNLAGVHYLSDYIESVHLGEQVAINFLRDYKTSFNEGFIGWSFNDFNGNKVFI